jgi:hypothetical protein
MMIWPWTEIRSLRERLSAALADTNAANAHAVCTRQRLVDTENYLRIANKTIHEYEARLALLGDRDVLDPLVVRRTLCVNCAGSLRRLPR